MSFTGEYSAKLNAKNQVTLPSALREALFALEKPLPLLLFDRGGDFLELYPHGEWEDVQRRTEARARERGQPDLNRLLNRSSHPVVIERDGDGRIVIPAAFMRLFKPGGELTFLGNTRRIEIFEAGRYRELYGPGSENAQRFRGEISAILDG